MISFDSALALVLAEAKPLGPEEVTLDKAAGRKLAAPLVAAIDAPRTDVSVMDGYAVREAELGETLRVVGESFPGCGFADEVGAGECIRIFTGAPVPEGCDRVVIQEQAERGGDNVRFSTSVDEPRFIRRRASDFAVGDVLAQAGRSVDSRALLVAAGADRAHLQVWRRPRVAILATGDELVAPGTARFAAEAVPDSLSIGIATAIAEQGGEVVLRERLPDDPAKILYAVDLALAKADVIVVTGGASVGEKDFAQAALDAAGMARIFSKVAMKPGKPVWFGRAGDSLVLGLPGNPVSAMVTARLFLAPLLAGLGGGDPTDALNWRKLPLAADLPACGDRETFTRARAEAAGAHSLERQESGAHRSFADADLLIRQRPLEPARQTGEEVEVLDL